MTEPRRPRRPPQGDSPPTDPGRGPARGYSWAPFTEGHTLSTRHGGDSDRLLADAADQIAAEVHAAAPWTRAPAFAWKVARFARAEASARARFQWLAERGFYDADGVEVPGWERWARAETMAATAEEALGLSPQSMAKLLGNLAGVAAQAGDDDALDRLREEGRRILEARGMLTAVPDDDGGEAA